MPTEISAAAHEAIEAAAKAAADYAIRARAHAFALEPSLLEGIEIGLSKMHPKKMRAAIMSLIEGEMIGPLRWYGFDGGTPLINLNGALHYADQCIAIESGRYSR